MCCDLLCYRIPVHSTTEHQVVQALVWVQGETEALTVYPARSRGSLRQLVVSVLAKESFRYLKLSPVYLCGVRTEGQPTTRYSICHDIASNPGQKE